MTKDEEDILNEIGAASTKVVKQDSAAKAAIDSEREAKKHFLELMIAEVRDALPAISSRVMFDGVALGAPFDRGVAMIDKKGASLFLNQEGAFFVVTTSPAWTGILTVDEVVAQRWDVREMAENLADELLANLSGKLKVVARAEEIAAKVRAVSILMGSR